MQTLTQTQQIYKYVKANKLATAQQVATALKLNTSTVAKLLYSLQQRNAVKQVKVKTMRCMYIANTKVKFNKQRTVRTSTKVRTANASTIAQAQKAIAQLQQLVTKLQKA